MFVAVLLPLSFFNYVSLWVCCVSHSCCVFVFLCAKAGEEVQCSSRMSKDASAHAGVIAPHFVQRGLYDCAYAGSSYRPPRLRLAPRFVGPHGVAVYGGVISPWVLGGAAVRRGVVVPAVAGMVVVPAVVPGVVVPTVPGTVVPGVVVPAGSASTAPWTQVQRVDGPRAQSVD